MGVLNIAEWSPDQVAEWMSGLAPTVAQYVPELRKRGLNGAKLLTLRCDDLEYLGIHIIGHQELLLEAVEHLRNYHYEVSRECVQQLALRVSAAAASLARELRHHTDSRLETHTLADVARTVHAVKPLVCWLDRWSMCGGALAERKAALLKLSLEAATCAQRERFAEQPARAVAAAAAAAAAVTDYIIQDVADPGILQPASVDAVTLRQGGRALGFEVVPSFCGHHQLAHIRFGSPAHASGLVHEGDEIVQVGRRCVIGWSGEAVERACGAAGDELALVVRRRGARPLPLPAPAPRALRPRRRPQYLHAHRYEFEFSRMEPSPPSRAPPAPQQEPARAGAVAGEGLGGAVARGAGPGRADGDSSDESEALSPPASPSHLLLDSTRLYPRKPRATATRRHTVSGGSPPARRAALGLEQFWHELQQQRWADGGSPEPDDTALYRRDKAVSYSTGLQLSPRPRTHLGVPRQPPAPSAVPPVRSAVPSAPTASPHGRGKLDKSQSTPAYDFDAPADSPPAAAPPLAAQTIPESPTTPPTDAHLEKAGQILDFKKSSSQIGEAILRSRRAVDDRSGLVEEQSGLDNERSRLDDERPGLVDERSGLVDKRSGLVDERSGLVDERSGLDDNRVDVSLQLVESVNPVLRDRNGPNTSPQPAGERALLIKYPKPRITERRRPTEVPPEPPPRPSFTQRVVRSPVPPAPPPREPLTPETASLSCESAPSTREPTPHARELTYPRSPPCDWRRSPVSPTRDAAPATAPTPAPRPRVRPADPAQAQVPPRHISKHDIHLVSTERREMPPINGEPESPMCERADRSDKGDKDKGRRDEIVMGTDGGLSPGTSVVRGIFPSSKTRSLKKKNSILAKRREVGARSLAARGAAGRVWQRVRGAGGAGCAAARARWAERHLLLAHNLLYAYRTPECGRAACMIYLEGFTVCAAGEVRSRAHAFKVYHTGTAFYFACDTRDAMLAWIQLIHRATLLPSLLSSQMELSKQFSETEYSDSESDAESSERRNEKEREREKEREKEKSKFGSLKKLTHRAGRSESQENVNQASSTSLDRKYLRFFSRARAKDDSKNSKNKQVGVPVPTEHYRSYRRAPPSPAAANPAPSASSPSRRSPPASPPLAPSKKLPKPINYIHASNPNLLDFEKSDFITKPTIQPPKPKVHKPESLIGLVTLEQFMLKKQEEERCGRTELQRRLQRVVPDVVYGELPERDGAARDGYEKIVFPEERPTTESWKDSLRRNDKVHSGAPPPVAPPPLASSCDSYGAGGGGGAAAVQGAGVSRLRLMFGGGRRDLAKESARLEKYSHLACPPTFTPETYSLARHKERP